MPFIIEKGTFRKAITKMLKWLDFKPEKPNFGNWLYASFNYYLRYKLRRFIKTDSFSIVFKVNVNEMTVDKDGRIEKRIVGLSSEEYTFELVDEASAGDLYKILYPWKRREFEKYFRNGSECCLWKIDNVIKCFTWSSYGKIDPEVKKEYNLDIPIGANDIWGMDIVVHPSYRGKAFEYLIFKATAGSLKVRKVDNIFASVFIGDKGSLKMHNRVGFKPEYLHHHKRILGVNKSKLYLIDERSKEIAKRKARALGVDVGFLWK